MKIFKYVILGFLSLSLFFACNPQPEASKLLASAEKFADNEQVDSALVLIDSIFYPEKSFKVDEYMQYLVTRTRVRYKAYRDIKGDTAVSKAWEYYKQKRKEPRWAALAAFYSGCVFREQGDKNKAMHAYVEALTEAQKTRDDNLKGLVQNNIGDLLWQQNLYSQALEAYTKAEEYYSNFLDQKLVAISNIGRLYMMMGKMDRAIVIFKRGLQSIPKGKSRQERALLNQNLSVVYSQQGEYSEALSSLKQAYSENTDSTTLIQYYYSFARIYSQMEFQDSAKYYNDLIKSKVASIQNANVQISIYSLLAQNEESLKNYLQSIVYLKKEIETYDKYLITQNNNSVLDIQQKYNFERLKNHYQENLDKFQYALIILLSLVIVGLVIFLKYRIYLKNQLIETHEKIGTLSKMALELEHSSSTKMALQEKNMRELLLWKFDVIKKSILLTKNDSDNAQTIQLAKKFHQIVYSNNQHEVWDDFEEITNRICVNLSHRMRDSFPNLSEKEYRICLLTFAGMSVRETAVILELSSNSVQTYRSSIRKKLGIEDAKIDTEAFLKEKFSIG